MKISLLVILFLSTSQLSAQRSDNRYLSIGFGLDFPMYYNIVSGELSGVGRLKGSPAYLGVGVQVAKIEAVRKVYIPVFINLMVLPETKGSVGPMIVLRPGIGVYAGNSNSGGFTAFCGAGIAFKGQSRFYLLGGYSRYGLANPFYRTALEGFGLRAGFLF